jgi:EryCIII-like glycosyltransferase
MRRTAPCSAGSVAGTRRTAAAARARGVPRRRCTAGVFFRIRKHARAGGHRHRDDAGRSLSRRSRHRLPRVGQPVCWRRRGRCVTVGEVNLQMLFTRVAAVVHHGGSGTTTIAARAGAPQVVIPQMYDQHYFARRIHDLGIGSAHASGMPTADSLTSALERALQPEIAARARAIAPQISVDGARFAAERLKQTA